MLWEGATREGAGGVGEMLEGRAREVREFVGQGCGILVVMPGLVAGNKVAEVLGKVLGDLF